MIKDKLKAGFIGFIPKGDDVDPYKVLKNYAKIGYKGFEGGDMLFKSGDPAENLKKVQSFGIEPLSIHVADVNKPDISGLVKRAKAIGVSRAATFVGCIGRNYFSGVIEVPGYDEIMREIETLDSLAKQLDSEGISLSFHNHHVELTNCYNGIPALYLMKENSQYLKFEIDCGWVTYAGYDPVTVLRSMGNRLGAVHIKDLIPGEVGIPRPDGRVQQMPRFTTPGTGMLNLRGCLETSYDMNMDYVIIEQDFQFNLTEEETVTAAYLNMKESGVLQ